MDRRQRKTREAIFSAFIQLLSEKNVNSITVGEIIDRADVGRATFYAHFETKDYLLKELCEELFCHVFDCIKKEQAHRHIFECDAPDSVFLHLFMHLKKNDNHILELMSGRNNELFLSYFKKGLSELIENVSDIFLTPAAKQLPKSFFVNHVCSSFVETVKWWVSQGMKESAEEIYGYFTVAVLS